MLFNWIQIPKKDKSPCLRAEFDVWVDNLSQVVHPGQIFMNSSEETARLLERAHPGTVVHLIRVDILTPFCIRHAEQMHKDMAFIQDLILAGNIVVFKPYKEYVLDGMRYIPKEVK